MNDLTERLHRAVDNLASLASDPRLGDYEGARLRGKIEGVKLALSYMEEKRNVRS